MVTVAVLIEGISVVIRVEAIVQSYKGGLEAFSQEVPNGTLRADGELASITFMTPEDARSYVSHLEKRGLRYRDKSGALDLVVVDQITGLCAPCDWVSFGSTHWNNEPDKPVAVCARNLELTQRTVVPNGWNFNNSLSARQRFIKSDNLPSNLKLIRREQNIDIYLDETTGVEYYVGRISMDNSSHGRQSNGK
jgi:hypothetical protein